MLVLWIKILNLKFKGEITNMELRIIQGTPIYKRYLKAFTNEIYSKNPDCISLKRAVLYGVKYINTHKYAHKEYAEREEIELKFKIIQAVKSLMELLTPKEFVNLFPIEKEYNHSKDDCWKDYFYTVNKLKTYNMDSPLGDKFVDFIWDYTNNEISRFAVETLSTASKLRQLDGQPSIMEEFAEKNNIPTYTFNEKDGYIINNQTHRSMPFKRKAPEYLKLVSNHIPK